MRCRPSEKYVVILEKIEMDNYIYCRISKDWTCLDENKWIAKLGSTQHIEWRKWWGSTERFNPCWYKWFITFKHLGSFPCVKSAEYTVYKYPFFKQRNVNNVS